MADEGLRNLETLHRKKVKKRAAEIRERFVCTERVTVTEVFAAETVEHLTVGQARRLKYRRVKGGTRWGQPWSTAWFRLDVRVPSGFRGQTVVLHFETQGESIVFRNGDPVQALDHGRNELVLFDRAKGGERLVLYVEAGASSAFGKFARRVMQQPWIGVFNPDVWTAYHDVARLADLVEPLAASDTRRARVLFELARAVDRFDYAGVSREAVRAGARAVSAALKPLYACRADASAQTIACIGHAHIDVAWLWPLAETIRKCGRTFSNVLGLMDRYPEFRFVQSQPQLYEFTRERYPGLYRRIRKKVKSGQWIADGATWVEMDCNVTSGESLVRQLLFGTRFFREEFGVEQSCLWLPDVFGYAASLPQILKRSGIDRFLTIKISWNQFTRFPYHSFWWEGIDGTRVLTHFPPSGDYNSAAGAGEMLAAAARYQEKDRSPIHAVPYGFGDGGGGPTPDMLERIRRYGDLEGMPRMAPMSPREFFDRLEKESTDLPRWVGELYLELHRGTYTTQGHNKANNRRCEVTLGLTEALSAVGPAGMGGYEQSALNAAWKQVLLHQFHDIIPGSSITQVYEDSDRQYAEVLERIEGIRDRAFKRLAADVDARGEGQAVLAFNSLGWTRDGVVSIDRKGLGRARSYVAIDAEGRESPVQLCADGKARFMGEMPSMGHHLYRVRPGKSDTCAVTAGASGMENDQLRVVFDREGRIRRLVDKSAGRDVLEPGKRGNEFILYEDKPTNWDAWDMDIFYSAKPLEFGGRLLGVDVVEQGPVRAVVRFKRAISKSLVTQDVVLVRGSRRLDFVTTVEWKNERDVLLKVAFPVNVRSDRARYEIQFGNVERPTHWNRPHDFAMFEVPAQRWVDLSEGDYGVALLNDCKYGHDTRDNVLRLSLLRAPGYPDPCADVNKTHRFTYALLPHEGGYVNGVVRAGYELNVPVLAGCVPSSGGRPASRVSHMSVSGDNVVIEAVKKAEDDEGIIVRLYEAHGCRGRRTFRVNLSVKRVVETNLMEKEERAVGMRNGRLVLDFKPFQIRTLKLIR